MMLTVKIVNDGTGNKEVGHYDCLVKVNNQVIFEGRVENHNRRNGIDNLLELLAKEIRCDQFTTPYQKILEEK